MAESKLYPNIPAPQRFGSCSYTTLFHTVNMDNFCVVVDGCVYIFVSDLHSYSLATFCRRARIFFVNDYIQWCAERPSVGAPRTLIVKCTQIWLWLCGKSFCLGAVRPIKVGGTLGHAGRMLATWSLNYSYDCNFIMYFLVAVSVSVSVTVWRKQKNCSTKSRIVRFDCHWMGYVYNLLTIAALLN